MNFSVNGQNVGAASYRVKTKRQGCLFYVAVSLWLAMCPAIYGGEGVDPALVKTESDCDKAAVLDLRVVFEEEALAGLVAPPAGVYPFEPGDGVVLRAYGMGNVPVTIEWSGDVAGSGETQFVDMDNHKRITVTFRRAELWPEKEESPWFDVAENKNYYAFLGGGDLYGWFVASRDKTKGAGITHLTHKKVPLKPILHFPSLNYEHIFSGVEADNHRVTFTPRTDPMRFCIESPGMARVSWPAHSASWDLDTEMTYCFQDNDAIDLTFSTVLGKEQFPLGYAGFMWASYHSNFKDHAIHFPGISDGKEGWIEYGPTIEKEQFGGTIACQGAPQLPVEDGASAFNIITDENIFFTVPLYYGLLDMAIPKSKQQTVLTYAMMFEKCAPIRFAVWNWGNPPAISAWDWQYLVQNPQPGQTITHRARMICAELDVPEEVSLRYEKWTNTAAKGSVVSSNKGFYPDMPIYWSPATTIFDLLVIGDYMERYNPDHALKLYREVVLTMNNVPKTFVRMDAILSKYYGHQQRIDEWIYVRDHTEKWQNPGLPLLYLAKAYRAKGDIHAAIETLQQGLKETPDYPPQLFLYGELLSERGEMEAGLEYISRAALLDPDFASPAGESVARYAEEAAAQDNFEQAEYLYHLATEIAPCDHWHKIHLGELLEKQGREEEAETLYRSVLLAAPESPYTARLVDNLYQARNDAAGQIRFWLDIHERKPDATVPLLHLGKAYYDLQDYVSAASVLEAAQALAGESEEVRFYQGAVKLWLDQEDEGLAIIKETVSDAPLLTEPAALILVARAKTLMESGDYAAAEMYFRKAIAFVPKNIWYPIYLGEALEKQGKDEEALALFIKGMNAAPDSLYNAELIHHYFIEKGDLGGNIQAWENIVENHPDILLPKIQRVRAYFEGGEYERAVLLAEQLETVDDPELLFYLNASKLYLADLEQGRAGLQTLARQETSYVSRAADAFAQRAQRAVEENDYELAAQLYRDALALAPTDMLHAVHLAETLERLDKNQEAVKLYVRVLTQIQDAPKTAALLDALLVRAFDSQRRIDVWMELHTKNPEAALPLLYLNKAQEAAGSHNN